VAIVLKNIGTLATCGAAGPQDEIHTIPSAALVWEGGEILWIGPERDLPGAFADAECWDAGGRLVIPGLVDCHTHLAFGGDRADEFEQRCLGTSYQAIAQAGGGIAATVGATRGTSEADLQDRAAGYLREMVRLGVTTVEAKSGYGLNLETERKLLTVYRHLGQRQPVRIVSTFLGAHVDPLCCGARAGQVLRCLRGGGCVHGRRSAPYPSGRAPGGFGAQAARRPVGRWWGR